MRIHVGNADLVPDLIRYFEERPDCVVTRVGSTQFDVSLLGSYRNDRHEAAVESLLHDFWLRDAN